MNKEQRIDYISDMSEKIVSALDDVFGSAEPKPIGLDMLDAVAFASVMFFANQCIEGCNGTEAAKSVFKSCIAALDSKLTSYAEILEKDDSQWQISKQKTSKTS